MNCNYFFNGHQWAHEDIPAAKLSSSEQVLSLLRYKNEWDASQITGCFITGYQYWNLQQWKIILMPSISNDFYIKLKAGDSYEILVNLKLLLFYCLSSSKTLALFLYVFSFFTSFAKPNEKTLN